MNVPNDLKYAETHEWIRPQGTKGRVGISDHAQAELTDVVYVELPKVGTAVKAGAPIAVVESVKAASDIYAPASGTVVAVNSALDADPALVNTDPYGDGWIFELSLDDVEELKALNDADEYREQLAEGGH